MLKENIFLKYLIFSSRPLRARLSFLVSKTLRTALEEEVKRKEIEENKRLFEEASKKLSKISTDEIVSEIRKMRESR